MHFYISGFLAVQFKNTDNNQHHMGFIELIFIGLSLAMDCFAVCVCISSIGKIARKELIAIPAHFGFFQGGMVLIGVFAGSFFIKQIESFDHWIAFLLLLFIGSKMIVESFKNMKCERITSEKRLILLSIATSIDALAVGISLRLIFSNILLAAITIGGITFAVSLIGLNIGKKIKHCKYSSTIGGVVLIAIGLKILFEHLFT
jgi:putative Mn2+ efflux pump MntP